MGDIVINKVNGGLGRILPNQDHISGFVFYNDTIPNWLSKDVWVTSTAYVIGDIIYNSTLKQYYKCNTAHTSDVFSTDIANWDVYTETVKEFKSILSIETAGIAKDSSDWSYEWYQLSEYFRVNPEGDVFVFIAPVPSSTYDYAEVVELQRQAEGKVKQAAICAKDVTFAVSEINALQLKLDYLMSIFTPIQALYTGDFSSFTDVTTLPDLSALATPAQNVSVVIGQDGGGYGVTLGSTNMAAMGAFLGALSKAKVSYSIAWVERFNLAGTDLATPALANGQLISDLSDAEISGLDDSNYLFVIKRIGATGSYANDSWTCDAKTSDYSTIEANRVYNKAYRGIRSNLINLLYSPLAVQAGGTMTGGSIDSFKTAVGITLFRMLKDAEVTSYSVDVDPTQNVLATSKVFIDIRLRPYGVARDLEVTLGFSVNA